MLDHDHRVALIPQLEQQVHQLLNVHPVEPRSRFIEDVERRALLAFAQFERELDALGLAAGQRRRRLAERQIAEADGVERGEFVHHARNIPKQRDGLAHRHIEDVGNRFSVEQDLQRLAIIAPPTATRARRVGVGHELHIQFDGTIALTALAAPAPDVEGKPAGLVATNLGERHLRVEIAQQGEQIDVARWIGARTAADRLLVDLHQLFKKIEILNLAVFTRDGFRAVEFACGGRGEDVVDQCAFAGTAHPGHTRQQANRKLRIDVAEIIRTRLAHRQPGAVRRLRLRVARDREPARKVRASARLLDRQRGAGGRRALKQQLPALDASLGTELDHLVGEAHGLFVMLDHEHRVAAITQRDERIEEFLIIVRVQSDARLVEHVNHADQAHPELCREPDALRFTAGQRGVVPVERQVTEPGLEQKREALSDAGDDVAHGLVGPVGRDEFAGERIRCDDIEPHEIRKRFTAATHGSAPRVEARAVALGTLARDHESREPRLKALAVGVPPTVLQIRNHPGKGLGLRLPHPAKFDGELPLAGTPQQLVPNFFRQRLPRYICVERQLFGELLDQ